MNLSLPQSEHFVRVKQLLMVVIMVIGSSESVKANENASPTLQDSRLRNVTWHLVAMDGKSFVAIRERRFALRFIGDAVPNPKPVPALYAVEGTMICNYLTSDYTIPITETMYFPWLLFSTVGCLFDDPAGDEIAFGRRLQTTIRYSIETKSTGQTLRLYDAYATELLRFSDTYSVTQTYLPWMSR